MTFEGKNEVVVSNGGSNLPSEATMTTEKIAA